MSDTLDPADSARVAAVKALLPAITARRTGISNVSLIVPRLYLSNYTTATDNAELERLGITHMVSVMDFTPANCPAHIKRLHVVLQDTSTANILQHLEQTTEFITAALQENETNKVLVHCLMGISRSATVVCAYLIAAHNMTADEALDLVMEKRTIACPNLGFRLQLETYESKLRKRASTTQGPLTRSRTKLWKAESKMVSEGVTSKVFRTFIRSRSIKQSSHQNAEDNSGGSCKPDETPSPC